MESTINQRMPPIMKLLLAGIKGSDKKLRETCYEAIEGSGPGFSGFLQLVLEQEKLTLHQRRRLEEAMDLTETVGTDALQDRRRAAMRRAVLQGICSPQKEVQDAAIAALPDLGANPAGAVVAEAVSCMKQPARCQALLAALRKSGLQVGPADSAMNIALGMPSLLAKAFAEHGGNPPAASSDQWGTQKRHERVADFPRMLGG